MNDLIAIQKIADWKKLKTLVLDSVSSPITKRVYNMGLDEFLARVPAGAAARLHKGHRERLAGIPGGPRLGSSSIISRMSAIRKLAAEAAGLMHKSVLYRARKPWMRSESMHCLAHGQ